MVGLRAQSMFGSVGLSGLTKLDIFNEEFAVDRIPILTMTGSPIFRLTCCSYQFRYSVNLQIKAFCFPLPKLTPVQISISNTVKKT